MRFEMTDKSLKILIVDNEECIRESLRMHLSEQGHDVLTASEPVICNVYRGEPCSQEAPCGDVLIMDQNMRTMKGLDFFEKMEQNGCRGLPQNKLVMSGSASPAELERARLLGCRFIQKPFTLPEVDKFIESVQLRTVNPPG